MFEEYNFKCPECGKEHDIDVEVGFDNSFETWKTECECGCFFETEVDVGVEIEIDITNEKQKILKSGEDPERVCVDEHSGDLFQNQEV